MTRPTLNPRLILEDPQGADGHPRTERPMGSLGKAAPPASAGSLPGATGSNGVGTTTAISGTPWANRLEPESRAGGFAGLLAESWVAPIPA